MIKVDIVSGFLGAGKTTLIKRYLEYAKDPNENVIIIENEFGPENIDGKVLSESGARVLELSNGCLCCTMKGEFETALLTVARKGKPDRIIIEPSGLFILTEFFRIMESPEIREYCEVNAVITVVDAQGITYNSGRYGMFFQSQIALSKTVMFAKTKGISAPYMKRAENMVRSLNPDSRIVTEDFTGLSAEEMIDIFNSNADMQKSQLRRGGLLSRGHSEFTATGLTFEKKLNDTSVKVFADGLKSGRFGDIARAKGFVPIENGVVEFNYVNGTVDIRKREGLASCSVNLIGERINKEALEQFVQELA